MNPEVEGFSYEGRIENNPELMLFKCLRCGGYTAIEISEWPPEGDLRSKWQKIARADHYAYLRSGKEVCIGFDCSPEEKHADELAWIEDFKRGLVR